MKLIKLFYFMSAVSILFIDSATEVSGDDGFVLPVQLVGFPFIIAAVRIVTFFKKMSYALNPATYRSRNRRALAYAPSADLSGDPLGDQSGGELDAPFDVQEVEKYIVGEFGTRVCVFERVCAQYAARAQALPRPQLDWVHVFRQYKQSPDQAKEFYLLSVFMGDIVASPQLCHQIGKRRGCNEQLLKTNADT